MPPFKVDRDMEHYISNHIPISGFKVQITTTEVQVRKHHKRRINKKWRKRYGVHTYEMLPANTQIVLHDGVLYMSAETFKNLKTILPENIVFDDFNIDHSKERYYIETQRYL